MLVIFPQISHKDLSYFPNRIGCVNMFFHHTTYRLNSKEIRKILVIY